ncbi:hypothetical protein CIRG_08584 [Coccidioides immitis RMSCC 2394]|uniref:Uncharacterized protein n=1 Tax=Coccidioides immitis RMSCC 2394 TaxID=404692 RepID=A0A0J6YPK2_COCIT|nr:hypothetical protein CIRG_08584 [Coccidioides immitis RMSCC 2394]
MSDVKIQDLLNKPRSELTCGRRSQRAARARVPERRFRHPGPSQLSGVIPCLTTNSKPPFSHPNPYPPTSSYACHVIYSDASASLLSPNYFKPHYTSRC